MSIWLFVPGDRPDRIRKAAASSADFIIVDWEDAVSPENKAAAREATGEVLGELKQPGRFAVRINAADTAMHEADLQAIAEVSAEFIMVAKVDGPDDLARAQGFGRGLLPLIETALGFENIVATARAPGTVGLALGYIDYLADIDGRESRESLLFARSRLVNAARAAKLAHVIDGVFAHIDDVSGLEAEARHVRDLGFNGKLAIHPRQVDPIRGQMQPPVEQVAWARDILRLFEQAQTRGEGAFRHQGQMIDIAVVRRAERILARFEA